YSLLAGYEILSATEPSLKRFQEGFRDYPSLERPAGPVNGELASLYGILETGRLILPSGYLLEAQQAELLKHYSSLAPALRDSSVAWARRVAAAIAGYARSDGYFRLSNLPRYRPVNSAGHWRPTPPEYMAAVEPNWHTIRPFFLDSSRQVPVAPPAPYSTDSTSPFYAQLREVYLTGSKATGEQKAIADFWDCNPFAIQFEGHLSIGLKKISPGGHWLSITGIAAQASGQNLAHSLQLHTLVALTLHDGFIRCWTEKYRSQRVRPETAIQRLIDERWKPRLQTPPFPEYPSGHSVISTACSEVLTHFLGDGFRFNDTTELYIGLPARTFTSFREAAAEAGISRLYGGIHFRDAVEEGALLGNGIARHILDKLALPPYRKP
ncbi:MAG TPA: vanadium-dependent haloperoxidase, partial [Chitinophagaceae bacterium]|nr:vanadium-dependent haloperoxidase [Chitinophagaceae bacterium]